MVELCFGFVGVKRRHVAYVWRLWWANCPRARGGLGYCVSPSLPLPQEQQNKHVGTIDMCFRLH